MHWRTKGEKEKTWLLLLVVKARAGHAWKSNPGILIRIQASQSSVALGMRSLVGNGLGGLGLRFTVSFLSFWACVCEIDRESVSHIYTVLRVKFLFQPCSIFERSERKKTLLNSFYFKCKIVGISLSSGWLKQTFDYLRVISIFFG